MVQQLVKTYLKKDIPNIIEDLERYRNDVAPMLTYVSREEGQSPKLVDFSSFATQH